jgi:hypothetical protein
MRQDILPDGNYYRNVTHYSYFGAFRSSVSNVGPNAAMLDQNGRLTDIGSWYMGGVATNNIPKKSGASRTVPTILRYLAFSFPILAWAFLF